MNKFFQRKEELIKRDLVYKNLVDTFNVLREKRNNQDLTTRYRISDPVCDEIENFYGSPRCSEKDRKKHQNKYPLHWKLLSLKGEVANKWLVNVRPDFSTGEISLKPYSNDEVILVGSAPVIKGRAGVLKSDFDKYPRINWIPCPNPFNKEPILADVNEFITPGYNKTGQKFLPIIINVSRLNKSDAKQVKGELWKIIDSQVQKGQNRKPLFEHEKCAFLYSLRREDTFKNYLRWYDIHTQEKLSFRLTAVVEKIRKENISGAEELLNRFIHEKVKWGDPVRGEDRIEKGIKRIYEAIHRKPYVQKEIRPIVEQYHCAQHGNDCKPSCVYYKTWMGRFNRLNKIA